jgi:hypothetical protein
VSYINSVVQNVLADANNQLTAGEGSPLNLAANAVFAGTAASSLGVAGIQPNICSDQNMTVYVDQSNGIVAGFGTVTTNGTTTLAGSGTKFLRDLKVVDQIWVVGETVRVVAAIASDISLTVTAAFSTTAAGLAFTQYTWDITDTFNYYTRGGVGNSWTVQATAAYLRIRIKNVGAVTTTFIRLFTALCPVVDAVPRSLCDQGFFKTGIHEIVDDATGQAVGVSPAGELRTAGHVRLTGVYFGGDTVDTNFWLVAPTVGGTATQTAGAMTLNCGAGPAGGVLVTSQRVARYVGGAQNYFRGVIRVPAKVAGVNACVWRWGAFDATDGFFFTTDGTTLSVICRKASSDVNAVASGAFNGDAGQTYTLDGNAHIYEIYYENRACYFYIDNVLIHKFSAPLTTMVATLHLKIGLQVQNAAGADLNTLVVRSATINRMGSPITRPQWRYQAGALAATVLKFGPGTLHRLVLNKTTGTSVTLYDSVNTGAPANPICIVLPGGSPLFLEYGLDFYTGLMIVTVGSVDITVVYE